MIGSTRTSPQRIPVAITLLLAACGGGGGGGSSDTAPTLVAASFVGATGVPATGDSLRLLFSEPVAIGSGLGIDDSDLVLSPNATVGTITAAPALLGTNTVVITLGNGVSIVPGTTTVTLTAQQDAVRDLGGKLALPSTPVTITTGDNVAPGISRVTAAGVDSALNGTGSAGGTLQLPANGWTIDLAYSDNGAIDTARTTITATVTVGTPSGAQPAGTDLRPFLTTITADNTTASYRVPAAVTFPSGPVTLTCLVVDASGLGSAPASLQASVRPFTDALRPFETGTNSSQVWFLDFARDVESYTTSTINGGVSVDVVTTANGRSDFEDLLRIVGLNSATPIANTQGGQDSNVVAQNRFKTTLLQQLSELYSGANIQFTLTRPSGAFGSSSSVSYASIGYSQISIAGASTSAGVLGVAIFDPSNDTQNDNTRTDFLGTRLGIFLHTIVDSGLGPPSSSLFRLTFGPFTPALGGTPIGNDPQDDERLNGTVTDARFDEIFAAIDDLARFCAVITAHECGHSMGLVQNGAMPLGLYGNDTTNFPGSSDGHIRTAALFPAGASNVMSPTLSYSIALNPATTFNSLNLAYLREQVFYGN